MIVQLPLWRRALALIVALLIPLLNTMFYDEGNLAPVSWAVFCIVLYWAIVWGAGVALVITAAIGEAPSFLRARRSGVTMQIIGNTNAAVPGAGLGRMTAG